MKFIYTSDVHYGGQPISRIDNYNESILNKLQYMYDYAVEHEIESIVIGGDLFDSPRLKLQEIITIVTFFRNHNSVKWLILHGNDSHDGHPDSSPMQLLRGMSHVWISCYADYKGCKIGNSVGVFVEHGEDNVALEEYSEIFRFDGGNMILFTHDTIVKQPVMFDHVLFEDYNTSADLVLLAHYHPYQGKTIVGDTIFYGPGALSRRKRIKHDIERDILFAVIDDTTLDIEEVIIPVKKDIWAGKTLEFDSDFDSDILKSIEKIKNETNNENMSCVSLEDMLKEYCKQIQVDTEVLQLILNKLSIGGLK